ncbi:MAG: hypothetical protein CBC46_06925 [Verrucomicrobiaceae bacterium TMED86]|nr:MAG: hypothetical protein CBC46_06925 [Verrucomicrobiaceae bacterium TMED86]
MPQDNPQSRGDFLPIRKGFDEARSCHRPVQQTSGTTSLSLQNTLCFDEICGSSLPEPGKWRRTNPAFRGKISTYSSPNPISGPYSAEPRRFPNPFEIKIISGMPFSHCQAMRSSVEYQT